MAKNTKHIKGKRINGVLYISDIDPFDEKPKRKLSKGRRYSRKNLFKRT